MPWSPAIRNREGRQRTSIIDEGAGEGLDRRHLEVQTTQRTRPLRFRLIVLNEATRDADLPPVPLAIGFAEPTAVVDMPFGRDDPGQVEQMRRIDTHSTRFLELTRRSAWRRSSWPVKPWNRKWRRVATGMAGVAWWLPDFATMCHSCGRTAPRSPATLWPGAKGRACERRGRTSPSARTMMAKMKV